MTTDWQTLATRMFEINQQLLKLAESRPATTGQTMKEMAAETAGNIGGTGLGMLAGAGVGAVTKSPLLGALVGGSLAVPGYVYGGYRGSKAVGGPETGGQFAKEKAVSLPTVAGGMGAGGTAGATIGGMTGALLAALMKKPTVGPALAGVIGGGAVGAGLGGLKGTQLAKKWTRGKSESDSMNKESSVASTLGSAWKRMLGGAAKAGYGMGETISGLAGAAGRPVEEAYWGYKGGGSVLGKLLGALKGTYHGAVHAPLDVASTIAKHPIHSGILGGAGYAGYRHGKDVLGKNEDYDA